MWLKLAAKYRVWMPSRLELLSMDAEGAFELSTWADDGAEPCNRDVFVLFARSESASIVSPIASDSAAESCDSDGLTESQRVAGTSGMHTKALGKRRHRGGDEGRASGPDHMKASEDQGRSSCPRPGCVMGIEDEGVALSVATKSNFLGSSRGMVHLTKVCNRFLQKALKVSPDVKRTASGPRQRSYFPVR